MIEIIPTPSTHVIATKIHGNIDPRDVKLVQNTWDSRLKLHDKLNFYAEVQNVDNIKASAIWEDLKFMLKNVTNVNKQALVTSEGSLKSTAEVVDKLFPTSNIRTFSFSERDKALAWIQDTTHEA